MTVELAERAGKGLVGAILQTAAVVLLMVVGLQPLSEEGMLKAMVSPAPSLFAWLMAHRSEYIMPGEHGARSAVVVTVRVAFQACTDPTGAARVATASVAMRSRQRHFTVFSFPGGYPWVSDARGSSARAQARSASPMPGQERTIQPVSMACAPCSIQATLAVGSSQAMQPEAPPWPYEWGAACGAKCGIVVPRSCGPSPQGHWSQMSGGIMPPGRPPVWSRVASAQISGPRMPGARPEKAWTSASAPVRVVTKPPQGKPSARQKAQSNVTSSVPACALSMPPIT